MDAFTEAGVGGPGLGEPVASPSRGGRRARGGAGRGGRCGRGRPARGGDPRAPRAERSRHSLPVPQQHAVPPHSAGTAGGARRAAPHAPRPGLSRRKLRLHPRCSPRAWVCKDWAAGRVRPLSRSPLHLRCMCVLNAASRVFAPGQLELNSLACANGS